MQKYKNHIAIGIITLVLVAGISVIGVRAVEKYGTVTINNVENLTMNVEGNVDSGGDTLGASGTRFPRGISADSTSPSAGEVRGTTLTTTGAATIGGEIQAQRIVNGGTVTNASSSLSANDTLTAAEVCDSSIITVNSTAYASTTAPDFPQAAAGLTITLPATSTLFADCLDTEGDHVGFWFANLSPTAASTTVITAGTGQDLLECDDTSDCNVVIGGGDRAWIEIWRQTAFESNLDAYVAVTEYSAAD